MAYVPARTCAWSTTRSRKRSAAARGALASVVTAAALDALEAALDEAKAERIVALERRWA